VLIVLALAWATVASGIYQVIRDMRRKAAYERRLKKMLKRAMRQMLEETLAEEAPTAVIAPKQE